MLEKIKFLIIICSIFFAKSTIAQKDRSVCFEVANSKSNSAESLISVKLDEESIKSIKNQMVLLKISKKGEKIVPFQLEKERFINDNEANRLLSRSQRKPYGTNHLNT